MRKRSPTRSVWANGSQNDGWSLLVARPPFGVCYVPRSRSNAAGGSVLSSRWIHEGDARL